MPITPPPADEVAAPGPLAPAAGDEIDVLDLLLVLARRKKTIFWISFIFALAAVIVSLLMPVYYPAETKILPPQQSQSASMAMLGQLGALTGMTTGGLGLKNPGDLYVAMLGSRTVADGLIDRFNLQQVYKDKYRNDTRKDLEKLSNISVGKDGVISVVVEDKERKRAADLANGYVQELTDLMQRIAVTEASQRRVFFEKELRASKDNLANAEVELKRTQESTGLIQMDSQARAIIESVARLRGQLAAGEVQLRVLRSSSTEQNPAVIRTEQGLAAMRAQLAKLEQGQPDSGVSVQVPTAKVPEAGLEYVRKLRDVKYFETIYEILAKQFEAAKIDEAKNAPVIQVIDEAVQSERKSRPHRAVIVLLTTLAGFILAIIWVFGQEAIKYLHTQPERRAKLALLQSYLAKS